MDETFRVFHRVLTFIGVPFFCQRKWGLRHFFHQIFNYFIGILTFIFISDFSLFSSHDKILLIEGVCIWSTGLIMFISITICLIFRHEFRVFLNEMAFQDRILDVPLVQHVVKMENETIRHCPTLNELRDMVNSTQENLLRRTRVMIKVYLLGTFLCATLYICGAVYKFVKRDDDLARPLAFPMWFPWSLENLFVYEATFLFHAYSGYLTAASYPGFQCILILLLGQVVRQLKILAFILLNLDELSEELARDPDQWQPYCSEILMQTIKHYVVIKRFCNRLNTICRPFYLVLILNGMMLVCVCSVKIAISDKTAPDTIKYYIHETCYVLMVMILCLTGQQVENQSDLLERVVTEKWYIYDREHKKNVLIFKMALSQRIPIYIFGSIRLCLPTFTWFIKTGMSFFTLVMSVLEG